MHPIRLKFKTYIPHHYKIIIVKFHVDWWSGSREIIFLKIFFQSNMAARPCDLSIIREHAGIPKAWGTCVKFPLDLSTHSGEDFLLVLG